MHLLQGGLAILAPGLGAGADRAGEAPDPPARCFEANEFGELPSCEWNGTAWQRTFDGGAFSGNGESGLPGWFVGLAILMVAVGIATLVWRISLARRIATQSGMDPNQATELVFLEDDGLEAAYLAGSLRGSRHQPSAGASADSRTAEDRLRELAQLRDQGLVTDEEYEARRRAVLDTL